MPRPSKISKEGFDPRLSRLRVRPSTTELPHSTQWDGMGIVLEQANASAVLP